MHMSGRSALLFILLSTGWAASAEQPARLDAARMETLVKDQIALVRKGRLKEAQRSLDRKIATQKIPLDRADLLEAFGVELFGATASRDERAAIDAALDYLERAVLAYRLLLGNDHPDLATALVRKAELERWVRPQSPDLSTDVAYETAYRIRATKLGVRAITTLSTLIPMAELKALPSRANGDPAKIEAAAGLLHQVLDGTAGSTDPAAQALNTDARRALQALDAEHGAGRISGRRLEIFTPEVAEACGAVSPDDVMVFSGEASALRVIRDRFAKARLTLRPCGALLLFPFTPGVDPSPVLDLLSEISAGRMPGVRMNLIEGSKGFGR